MRHFIRHSRWRRAFVGACLPYLLLAMFVDFLHGHRPDAAPAPPPGVAHVALPPAGPDATPDYACPVCAWLRMGPRLDAPFSLGACAEAISRFLVAPAVEPPDSSNDFPIRFRGPPSAILA